MKFNPGTIVTLKSNGLIHLANYNFLSIGGNENFTTPLMVVVEILINNNDDIDEETGEIKSSTKNQNKYKCMYFSNKSMKFEENWFIENEIEIYGAENEHLHSIPTSTEIKRGEIVRFKTVDEEAKKSKSFNESDNNKGNKSLITFIAPALQVVGFTNPDKKEPLIDPHTGNKRRIISSKMVKCKFFSTDSDKFSEQLVPIECLQFIDNGQLEVWLEEISKIISKNNLVLIETPDVKCFGKPTTIHVYSGRYQLSLYNELTKKHEFVWVDQLTNLHEVNTSDGQYYPGLNDGSGELTSILDFLESIKDDINGKHFKITYCNLKEQRVSRYITIKLLGNELKDDSFYPEKKYYYLQSYCHLREATRDFRSDRILSIRTINNERLNEFLSEKLTPEL